MNTYTVQKGDTLYGIAKKYNTSVDAIKKENNLSNDRLYIGQKLKVNSNGNEPLECIVYTVKKGDNLYAIAKKYNTTVNEIKSYNNLSSNSLQIGDRIIIPCNVLNDYKPGSYVSYTVEKGDSLYSIANRFGTTIDKIISDNDLKSNILQVGTVLIVDDNKGISSVKECYGNNTDTVVNNKYIVQKGESLYSIAKKFNTSVDNIKRKNNLSSNLISIGQELII
ncbi:MAG: LysM peptidoglycan-binding domain-containing protein [Bacilli bacterium]|nr:LysM peptidoglycan-binding domain-containing protein [Bacilli bacterium]